MNRSQLARKIGTAWVVVDRWERGRTVPTVESIIRIAKALDVSFDQLLSENATDPTAKLEALRHFRSQLAPEDLTPGELRWLEAVPDEAVAITPNNFAELLQWYRSRRNPRCAADDALVRAAE